MALNSLTSDQFARLLTRTEEDLWLEIEDLPLTIHGGWGDWYKKRDRRSLHSRQRLPSNLIKSDDSRERFLRIPTQESNKPINI